jgi:FkbM family methyltransferase
MVNDLVKEMVARTPIEPLARAMYGWVSAAGRHDRQLRQVMDRVLRPNSNCVDVGCGRGQALREFLRRAPQGRHLAIEPAPERFARLKTQFPQVGLFNVAASDQSGEGTCTPLPSMTFEGLLSRRCAVRTDPGTYRVLTATLDELVPPDLAVRFLRVNVRAGILAVLTGALGLIRRCHPYLAFDVAQESGRDSAAQPDKIYDLLTENGLAISLTDDWLIGNSPIARSAFASQFRNRPQSCFLAHP